MDKGVEDMSITFHNTIVHVLDTSIGHYILSSKNLALEDEIEAFITKHIGHLFESNEVARAVFNEEGELFKMIKVYKEEDFYQFSCKIADKFFQYMLNDSYIKSGDVVVSSFTRNQENFLGIIKLNYREAFTHQMDEDGDGIATSLIKQRSIFSSNKIDEALLINKDSCEVWLLDKSKEKYLAQLLEIENQLSIKEKLVVVEHITNEVIEEHFTNPVEVITTLKSNIAGHIFENSSVPVAEVIKETFKDYKEVEEECMQKMEQCGFKDEQIVLTNPKEAKKYISHKLKTNTGVEIKLPTQMIHDIDFIEFINEPNGTISIVLKNIGEIINK